MCGESSSQKIRASGPYVFIDSSPVETSEFSLKSLFARMYVEQVFAWIFPWQVFTSPLYISVREQCYDNFRPKPLPTKLKTVGTVLPQYKRSKMTSLHSNNFPCWKTGMTSFSTKLLVKEIIVNFCRAHEQMKRVRGNLLLCTWLLLILNFSWPPILCYRPIYCI